MMRRIPVAAGIAWSLFGFCVAASAQTPSFTFVTSNPDGQGLVWALSDDGRTAGGHLNGSGFTWTAAGGIDYFGTRLGIPDTRVFGVSADGGTAVGGYTNAYRLTGGNTIQRLGRVNHWMYSSASCVSADGVVVAGTLSDVVGARGQAFIWTQGTGMVALGSEGGPNTQVSGMSRDGRTLLGSRGSDAYSWTATGGFHALENRGSFGSQAFATNPSETVIVGLSGNQRPAVWTNDRLTELDIPLGFSGGYASCVSSDGGVIGGLLGGGMESGFVWTLATGTLRANDFFARNGVAVPQGWVCDQLFAVSDDGMIFGGRAIDPTRTLTKGFIATIPTPGVCTTLIVAGPVISPRRRIVRPSSHTGTRTCNG